MILKIEILKININNFRILGRSRFWCIKLRNEFSIDPFSSSVDSPIETRMKEIEPVVNEKISLDIDIYRY